MNRGKSRHVIERVVVSSVLKNGSGAGVSQGDSLDVIARVGRMVHRADDESIEISTEYFRHPAEPGYTEVLAIRFVDGEWLEGKFCPHREIGLVPSLRRALLEHCD